MLDDLIKRLKPYHTHEIAAWSGLSLSTVENVTSGRNENPTLGTIQKLVRFANQKEKYNEHARKGDEA